MRECEALCFVICVCMRVFWGFRGKCNERIMGKGKEFVFCGCSSVLRRIRKMIGGAILETMVSAKFEYIFFYYCFIFKFLMEIMVTIFSYNL